MKKENDKGLSKKFWLVIITICCFLLVFTIIGFVLFANRKPQLVKKTEKGGQVSLTYSSTSNVLKIAGGTPLTDSVGMSLNEDGQYFDFTVNTKITKASKVEYEISVKKISLTTEVPDSSIKVYLEKEDSGTYSSAMKPHVYTPLKKESALGTEKNSMVLIKQERSKTTEDNYRLRTWISESSLITDANYSLQVNIKAKAK